MKIINVSRIASEGIAIGRVHKYIFADLSPSTYVISQEESECELRRFHDAMIIAKEQIEAITDNSSIFQGHSLIVADPILLDSVSNKIIRGSNAEQALYETMKELLSSFEAMEDSYIKERASDIKDVCFRIMRLLKGVKETSIADFEKKVIIAAKELTPSDVIRMDEKSVLGIITELGGETGHVSILARQKGIPAVVGVSGILEEINTGDMLILDAIEKSIIISPGVETIKSYEVKKEALYKRRMEHEKSIRLPAKTIDGRRVKLFVNINSVEDVNKASDRIVDGIGLFRTEFLYMEQEYFPTEEEQLQSYRKVVESSQGEVVIRTLDIGGDKELSYSPMKKEDNPYLGWRGIRFCLDRTDIFKTQLRAILRAAVYGKIKILLPMVTTLEELYHAKELLEQCKIELKEEKKTFESEVELGIMVETPAAVIGIEGFAREADFLSIGTNDLTQYLMAADRNNPKTSGLCDSFQPVVIKGIAQIIDAGKRYKKQVGMCGAFAAEPKAIPLLIGLGLEEFSVSIDSIARVKHTIRNTSFSEAEILARKALKASTLKDIMDILNHEV